MSKKQTDERADERHANKKRLRMENIYIYTQTYVLKNIQSFKKLLKLKKVRIRDFYATALEVRT